MDHPPSQSQWWTSVLKSDGSLLQIAKNVASEASSPEVSVVMPCLNEADTLDVCLEKAQRALCEHQIAGEIIVADNGSTDGSQAIAARNGREVSAGRSDFLNWSCEEIDFCGLAGWRR